jgi:malonyl-CoA O-methyltransferase
MAERASKVVLPVAQGYDLWSELYDGEDNPLIKMESDLVFQLLGDLNGLKVADLGCGTGRQTLKMAEHGAEVTGIDFSEGMLRQARAKTAAHKVRFIKHDLETELPFEAAAFDRVVSCLALDHVKNLGRLFAEMKQICRPEGRIVISVMHPAMMLRGVEAHFHDPETGQEIQPSSAGHQISGYVVAANQAGLVFEHMSEHAVDARLAAQSERARRHLGWPLLLLMGLRTADRNPKAL